MGNQIEETNENKNAKKMAGIKKKPTPTNSELKQHLDMQLFNLVAITLHKKLLFEDKQYFRQYSQKIGISERKLRKIMNGKFDEALPPLLAQVRRMGVKLKITYTPI